MPIYSNKSYVNVEKPKGNGHATPLFLRVTILQLSRTRISQELAGLCAVPAHF